MVFIILLLLFIVGILGLTMGGEKSNRTIVVISVATCIIIIAFALFLVFIIIPAM